MKPSIAITEWSEILANQSDEAIIDFVAAPFHEKIYQDQSFDLSISDNMNFQSKFSFKIFETDGMRISGAARLT